MMMLKMMNPMGSMPSVPKVGGEDEGSKLSREELQEQEKMRQDAIKKAEKERKAKYQKQKDEREGMSSNIRGKYNIEKKPEPEEELEDESDEEDDGFGPKKKVEEKDAVTMAKEAAEAKMKDAQAMMSNLKFW